MADLKSDDEIYDASCGPVSPEDATRAAKLLQAWADATVQTEGCDAATVLRACIATIGMLGPAYCRVAAATLVQRAAELKQ
jgi:hypothetical protein